LEDTVPGLAKISIGHGVVFTDVSVDDSIGLYGPRALIIDRNDLRSPVQAIERLCLHWTLNARVPPAQLRSITNDLAPTVSIRTRLRDVLRESEDTLIQLTSQQAAVFRQLRRLRRLEVLGGAGTGKTILAVERAVQLAGDYETLLVCYNEPLAGHISRTTTSQRNLTVATFHSLCFRAARRLAQLPTSPTAEWWEHTAANLLQQDAAAGNTSYGALVIDEVQDFAESWITSLLLLLDDPDNSPCYLFGDTHQHLYRAPAGAFGHFPQFTLDINCRNTLPIAERVAAIFADPRPTTGASGASPTFIRVKTPADSLEAVQDLVVNLLDAEGLAPDHVVVLSDDGRLRDALRNRLAGDTPFVGLGESGVVVESISRFKGLEAAVVVLALSDALLVDANNAKAVVYVAMSRARSALFVIGSTAVRRAILWSES
jgi:superfamily I DNA and RNA helicase